MSKSTRIVELVHMLSGRRSRTVAETVEIQYDSLTGGQNKWRRVDPWKIFTVDGDYKVHLRFDKSLAPLFLNARHHPGEETTKRKDGPVELDHSVTALAEAVLATC